MFGDRKPFQTEVAVLFQEKHPELRSSEGKIRALFKMPGHQLKSNGQQDNLIQLI